MPKILSFRTVFKIICSSQRCTETYFEEAIGPHDSRYSEDPKRW